MGRFDVQKSATAPSRFSSPKASKSGGSRFSPAAPGDESVSQLETEASESFATPLIESAKGAGRTVIDLLSRPSYAMAGAAEELFTERGGGIGAAIKRAGRELGSGIGGIKGDKENFSQILEQSGVDELGKLSDVLGFAFNDTGEGARFQRGGWADPTGRGAIGLGLDIFTDPTTYLTAGGAVTRRFLSGAGVKYLSKDGQAVLKSIEEGLAPAYRLAATGDDVSRVTARRQVVKERQRLMDDAIAKDAKLLDSTGVKWFGNEVISQRSLDGLSDQAKRVVLAVPGGDWAARQAESLAGQVRRVFDPYADLAGLPPDVRDGMKAILRENRSAAAMHKSKALSQWAEIEKSYAAEARKYGKGDAGKQSLGKKYADWREKTGTPTLTADEAALFGRIDGIYDELEGIGVREGSLDAAQALKYGGRYLHHQYKNTEEALAEIAEKAGVPVDRIISTERFQRERHFDTYADAVRVTQGLKDIGETGRAAGLSRKTYGALEPEYDAMKNLGSYIQQSTDAVWRKKTFDEVKEKFGHSLDEFYDASKVYDLNNMRQIPAPERAAVDAIVNGVEAAGFKDLSLAARSLQRLSGNGRKELARELASRVKSESGMLNVIETMGNDMPSLNVVKGTVDPYYAKLGQDGNLVPVKGGLWGDKEIQIPRQVAKIMDDAPRDFLMDAAKRRGLQGFVQAWDKYNNAFKMVTYPFYPSGAVRDTYNNVMQGFLGIGVGAFARPFRAGRVLMGGDEAMTVGSQTFKQGQWKQLAQDLGVTDPSAASFAQFTGERGAEKATALVKARVARGQVDNASRVQLWLNNMAAGMTPEDAAGVVKEFLFDYGELSAFDRDIMRRAMPFYVFPRKAIETYGRAAIKTPGRVVNLAKPFRGREDENNSMTTWEGEGFKMRLDRDGQNITMLNGVDLPVRTLDVLWRGNTKRTLEGLVAMTGPALKVPYIMATGRDPFRGQELTRQDAHTLGRLMESAPKWAQSVAGYKKETDAAGRAKYTVRADRVQALMEGALISRIFSTGDRAFMEQIREPNTAARLLDIMTGLRFKTLNLDDEKAKLVARRKRELEEALFKAGQRERYQRYYKKGQ